MNELDELQFIPIDKHLEQVVKTSAFIAKAKGQDKNVITMLEKEYEKDRTNLDNIAALCFYQWFLADDRLDLSDTNSVFQVTFNVINILDDVLEQKPVYWILWILKFKIQSFMNFNENELISDLETLSSMQKKCATMPYYLVTEVLLSHICYSKDRLVYAKDLLLYILDNYSEPINELNNFFKGYVIEYINLVKRSGDNDILELLMTIQSKYFK